MTDDDLREFLSAMCLPPALREAAFSKAKHIDITIDAKAILGLLDRAQRAEAELADAKDQLATIIDEAFSTQPVHESIDALLTTLERLLFERRQAAERERDEALAERDTLARALTDLLAGRMLAPDVIEVATRAIEKGGA